MGKTLNRWTDKVNELADRVERVSSIVKGPRDWSNRSVSDALHIGFFQGLFVAVACEVVITIIALIAFALGII